MTSENRGIEMLEILKTKARIILGKQKAMGVIEIVLIILVLVGLCLSI